MITRMNPTRACGLTFPRLGFRGNSSAAYANDRVETLHEHSYMVKIFSSRFWPSFRGYAVLRDFLSSFKTSRLSYRSIEAFVHDVSHG
jgi:hypothetical protein